MEITEAAISKAFSTQFTDVGHKPIPELGYSLDKWNGNRDAGASLSVACGMYFESDVGFSNAAVLSLDCPAKFDIELYRQLLRASIEAWDPDNAGAFSIVSVDTDERVQKLEWLTYQRDEGIIKQGLPPPSDES
jgi:hypothetical protein